MAQSSGQQFFTGASHFVLVGGTYSSVGGIVHNPSHETQRYGMTLLLANISSGAFHNASERDFSPRCHPHTRTAIREAIIDWIKAPDVNRKLILWLYGPAGAGKTAIEQSIADQCAEEGLLAASFFFGRTADGRNDSSRIVATLAYQLCQSIPEIHEAVLSEIEKDPTIFSRSLEVQMDTLVIAPLTAVTLTRPYKQRAILVDGIDECGPDSAAPARLLHLLGRTSFLIRHVHLVFLVTSRSEYEIRQTFSQEPLISITHEIVLEDDRQANDDIRRYLTDKFEEIYRNQLSLGTKFPSPWPKKSDIDHIVQKSSGQFIFASTVIKFIDLPRRHPVERLNIILCLTDAGDESPFAAIDSLYHFILSAVDDLPKVLDILSLLILGTQYSKSLSVSTVENLLGIEVHRALMDMHALVFVPPPTIRFNLLHIHHASFYDFLFDKSRSGSFYVNAHEGHAKLSKRWLNAIASYPCFPDGQVVCLNDCISRFILHCNKANTTTEIMECLAAFNLRTVLEKITNPQDLYWTEWAKFFTCIEKQTESDSGIVLRLWDEFYTFCTDKISLYPEVLRPSIPAVFCNSYFPDSRVFFSILQNLQLESTDAPKLLELDEKLLMMNNRPMETVLISIRRNARVSDVVQNRVGNRELPLDHFVNFDGNIYGFSSNFFFYKLFERMEKSPKTVLHTSLQQSYLALAKITISALLPL
ncbi:hypothetical protein BDN70DRAFT_998279 [Pholiota conissans]|uniref:NACHT domain-containing protein n=1 Tax=Pholiota conissans TaxID=109636 RepID=A0A9P5YNP5_9AGAR|nr:hypothetical protein BDN70DRAFT_998279 [Pholiota conissans]